ncbi:centrosomal protein of 85 kDa-like isoform X2 [Brienomyrus brachyistius]|uniref:centrosomal protein of 85 kDa-like isoform X2 n=1 Tax=Brienomyrus brachyistius TaxID=42636 RepID=UPI0020B1DB0B|nr:centrosomal protein of 85 kDa-like isoform X2 [Brienomyrus brachyistius]
MNIHYFDPPLFGSGTASPSWAPGCDSSWQAGTSSASSSSNRGRRHSTASDSADTGIGTSCSDSVEDHSSSSGTLSFQPLRPQANIPTAHVMPSPSSSKPNSLSTGGRWSSSQPTTPLNGPLDMKDPRPVRRWSSLTRLAGPDKGNMHSRASSRADVHGSLDRGLQYGSRLGSLQHGLEHLRLDVTSGLGALPLGSESRYRYDLSGTTDSSASLAIKPSTLDLTFSALPESRPPVAGLQAPGQRGASLGHQTVGGSPIQSSVRTQMWLSEQMHTNPVDYRPVSDPCGGGPWLQEQQRDRLRQDAELTQMLSASTLVKIKEGLLRQRELEIDRQKQQILQLHARIRENELRVQQALQNHRGCSEDTYLLKTKESPLDGPQLSNGAGPLCSENGEVGRRLAAAEMEVIRLNEFLKQNTQKYTEDIKKLEEKMKTRDRYISSLKKKCQREGEQNQERQQRIETLEKYLADLPSLDEVQSQAQQLEGVRTTAQSLQDKVAQLEHSLGESRALLKEKEALIESQSLREQELVASVQSLQEKVEKCLEDGVRLPMMDLKQLESENARLQEQHAHSSKILASQKKQMEKLGLELAAVEERLRKERGTSQELRDQLQEKDKALAALHSALQEIQIRVDDRVERSGPAALTVEVAPLLKEMSLCLLDLKALCSVLTQRAQGKEPNLALLLGIKSMNCSGEESEKPLPEDSLRAKLSEVRQLRREIDELRTVISDRYAQDMGDNCITQ